MPWRLPLPLPCLALALWATGDHCTTQKALSTAPISAFTCLMSDQGQSPQLPVRPPHPHCPTMAKMLMEELLPDSKGKFSQPHSYKAFICETPRMTRQT